MKIEIKITPANVAADVVAVAAAAAVAAATAAASSIGVFSLQS